MTDPTSKADSPTLAAVTPEQLADHAVRLVHAHGGMLNDEIRNRAFYKALKRCITSDSTVLDIGAGTGIWAVAAALLGAKRVVAIEADPILIGLIKQLAMDCGVGEKVHPVLGRSHQVQLDREFDVVVSETIGYDGFEEQIVPLMMDARHRFLRPGGRIIPETVALFAAAAHYRPLSAAMPRGVPFEFPAFATLRLDAPVRARDRRSLRILSESRCLLDVDLASPPQPSALDSLKASWSLEDASSVNCIAVWVESRLTTGVRLSTRRTSSWTPVVYPVAPTVGRDATLEMDLCLSGMARWRWSVTAEGVTSTQFRSPINAGERMSSLPTAPKQE